MAGDLCLIAFCLNCLLIRVSAFCRSSDQSEKCVSPKEFICVPDECGNTTYVCEDPFPVEPGKCPYFNKQLQRMDVTECSAEQVCSSVPYLASALVQKSKDCVTNPKRTNRCLEQNSKSTTEMNTVLQSTKQYQRSSSENLPQDSGGSGATVRIVVALLILVAIIVVILVVFYRRNTCGFKDKMELLFNYIRNHLQRNREGETRLSGRSRTDEETGVADETANPLLTGNEAPVNGSEKQKQEDKPMYATVNKDNSKKKEEIKLKIIKLSILQKYLVHILRREIDVKDLKEKYIIHSKSLGEHFTEPLLQDLYGVEKTDDYSKLDMSLVFSLLRNFCVNIKPPSRGWDYEPPEDEETVGADIERIRSMWNKYCDNDYDCKNLDDVFNRMKTKYGTVTVQNDQESKNRTQDDIDSLCEIKERIQSIKLNPDCFIENAIVITGGVKSALSYLEIGNVVICKGAIGCGKTHALKAIKNKYEEKEWKVRWLEVNILPIADENMEDKTIVICDNLFGSYGCNTFSSKGISSIEDLLENMPIKSSNIKFAVGIHQHVFDAVKRNHNLKILQNKNITVDLEKLTKSEMLLILREQQKEDHFKTDTSDLFKTDDPTRLIAKLGETQGHIGSPFLSLMYCHLPNLFLDEAFTTNPFQSLIQRFRKMRNDSIDFYSLIYLMCVKKHKFGDELTTWAGRVDAYLSKNTLQNAASKMPAFIRVENGVETLRHEVLTIALFKAASYVEEVFLPIVQNCEMDILVQLMRPEENCNTEFSCGFVTPKKSNIKARFIGKQLVKRFADRYMEKWDSIEHPLKSNQLFEEKFEHYLKNTPKEKKIKL